MALGTEGWAWSAGDYLAAWLLMVGVGFAYAWSTRKPVSLACCLASVLALFTVFLLVWINGAVGIIGGENNPAKILYAVVLEVFGLSAGFAALFLGSAWLFRHAARQATLPGTTSAA